MNSKGDFMNIKLALKNAIKTITNTNEICDNAHSMGDLYYHRMILTRALMHSHKEVSWKSKLHNDGDMIPGFFVVGISTPSGDITYHYKIEFWDLFDVQELDKAPAWDGIVGGSLERLLNEF